MLPWQTDIVRDTANGSGMPVIVTAAYITLVRLLATVLTFIESFSCPASAATICLRRDMRWDVFQCVYEVEAPSSFCWFSVAATDWIKSLEGEFLLHATSFFDLWGTGHTSHRAVHFRRLQIINFWYQSFRNLLLPCRSVDCCRSTW